ncbi:MAG: DUF1858 domain-containing protein [Myxococcales bacterium]
MPETRPHGLSLHGPARKLPLATSPDPAEGLYRRFLRAALWCTLTLGATFGAWNLLFIHLSLGEVPPSHQWVHGTFQILGFIQLFIFGVALQVVPRFLGTRLAHPRLAKALLPLVLAALLLRGYGALEDRVPMALEATALAALLELAAALGFARVVRATSRSSSAPREPFHTFLALGAGGWIVSALLLCAGAVQAAVEHDVASAAAWNEAFYLCALFGGALPFVQGVLLRAGPLLLGMAKDASRAPAVMALLGACGTMLCILGAAPVGPGVRFLDAGLICVSASVLLTARLRVAEGAPGDRTAVIVHTALAFSAVFAVLASLYGGLDLVTGSAPRLLFDAARHAFGLGFLTLMIFGMAGRIVPAFAGRDLRWPRLRAWGALLIAAGAALRMTQALAGLTGWEWPLLVSGPSGAVAAGGVALASASILGTLRAARPPPPADPASIGPHTNVGALLDACPAALEILLAAGFTPLANPIARRTLARTVTLRQACGLLRIPPEPLIGRLRERCGSKPP